MHTLQTLLTILLVTAPHALLSQTRLDADGPGNTYELINSILAPTGGTVIEAPDAVHPAFGRHIAEVWDAELSQYTFEFYIHFTPDDDRGINTDRQRVEIKTYDSSPDYLKGVAGETITYKWKFRIPVGFQPSSSFTHIHQIKPVGGDDGDPLFTLTPRKGNPNKMELIHNNATKVATVNLSLFTGTWVECTEVIKVGNTNGAYSAVIRRVSDGSILLSYSNSNLMTIRADNSFIRPKWGIYRSLNVPSDLRDEAVRFAGFFIQEGVTTPVAIEHSIPATILLFQNYPNPCNPFTEITYTLTEDTELRLNLYDVLGRMVKNLVVGVKPAGIYRLQLDVSGLHSGVYYYQLETNNCLYAKKMLVVK